MNATVASAAILTPLLCQARKARSPVDTGFIVYNEADLSQSHRAVRSSRRADATVRYVVCGFARRRRSGIFRQQSVRPVCRKAQPVPPALLVDAARPATLLSRSAARPRAARRVPHHARRLSRRRRLRRGVPARSSAADGGGDLVGARQRPSSIIRPRPSSASRTVTACSGCATGRHGAPCSAAAAPMSSA